MTGSVILAAVVVADLGLFAAVHPSPADIALYTPAVVAIVLLRRLRPTVAFVALLALAGLSGGAYIVLLWMAYRTGREALPRLGMVVVAAAIAGAMAGQLVVYPPTGWGSVLQLLAVYAVFAVLPLLAGRHVAQHERLLETLEQNSRLRIARDMHDSLGRRLSLASIQAAALEVSDLPAEHRRAVAQLAGSVRAAMDELYEQVGALRGTQPRPSPDLHAINRLVEEFQFSGVPVKVFHDGSAQPFTAEAGEAAFRVVEEGLTNAARHASGSEVTVRFGWEADALVLTIVNELVPGREQVTAGHGLIGLDERVRQLGGFLDHRRADSQFRLVAMLPLAASGAGRLRTVALGIGTGIIMFGLLPATMLIGVAP